ncbi:hypothetical protein TVAG_489980 [Trichomonas vaginalis G3]|uniref:Uncharacterized protein n=1 Tax=Trichomonas vaginalis (strain ATCC PRA-98 / G3) TaxID=412133 RepID=A2FB35_TRIV3|nr:guanylate cyclase protein [Trichomonas vaginalis G3]EAX97870.1 hypothetical protein TVAG_489980 [Trichomonas vaginalis G3]KAI5501150.1 guanylate cyclase protein [Trichomonas vaginalis G3]|eukprot:XP_001310800.1 hypothetical protein [Trichomonas vaginalis G3]
MTIENRSLQDIIIDTVQNAIVITKVPSLLYAFRHIAALIMNFHNYNTGLEKTSDYMMSFLQNQTDSLSKTFKILMIVGCVCLPIIILIVIWSTARWMSSQKKKIYACFNALPKTVLSKMIEKMNTQTEVRDNDASEKVDQVDVKRLHMEEKTIAILRSGEMNSDQNKKATIICYSFVLIVIMVVNIILICFWYINGLSNYNESTPQLHQVVHSFNYAYEANLMLHMLSILSVSSFNILGLPTQVLAQMVPSYISEAEEHFKLMIFGDPDQNIDPIYGFIDAGDDKFRNRDCDVDDENLTSFQIYKCSDEVSKFMKMIDLTRRVYILQQVQNNRVDASSDDLKLLWFFSTENVLGEMFLPLYGAVQSSLKSIFTKTKDELYAETIILAVVALIIVICYCASLLKSTEEVKMILYQLLHAPASTILQSDYIMTILSGDFATKARTGQAVDDAAFEEVAANFPDGICTIEGNQLANMNHFAKDFFGNSHDIPDDVDFNYARGNFSKDFLLEIGEKSAIASIQKYGGKIYLILRDNTNIKAMEAELA